jgi:hypothetical protein
MELISLINKLRKNRKHGYEKNVCSLCNQVCYNTKDLEIHLQRTHANNKKQKREGKLSVKI